MAPDSRTREWFHEASDALVATVRSIEGPQWEGPGLGVWTVRDLVGHTSRSYLTLESYLSPDARPEEIDLSSPVEYYLATRGALADADAVAERGRAAARALGDDPVRALGDLAERVVALVHATDDSAVVVTPMGRMLLSAYLPTRAFELTVHTLDLCAAIGRRPDATLLGTVPDALALATSLAVEDGAGSTVLFALTGRGSLPDGFSVV